jgi:hypothetical protein
MRRQLGLAAFCSARSWQEIGRETLVFYGSLGAAARPSSPTPATEANG